MLKNTLIAVVVAASFAGVAAPAFASSNVFGDDSTPEMRDFMANLVVSELQQKGVNATSVEDWSGLIRAFVTLADGTQVMQFYTPGSLEQVQL